MKLRKIGVNMFRAVDLIMKKRDGGELSESEFAFLIDGYVKNEIPDYQMSAFLMAIFFQKLSSDEMSSLTNVMLNSGEKIDLSPIEGIKVDKHSTGGVGDKTSLVVAPIVAAVGLKLAKMSGRGLGHTGGTLDKLEAIPGFKIEISSERFFKQVNEIGLAIIGQSTNITPADKKLYALRDVTGTIESIGLIASSIMSKKLASGADHIVLDVKVGSGAFMKDLASARELAKAMVQIGKDATRDTVAMLTNMEQPLGAAIGNTLEVIEAIETLKGQGPSDFSKLCIALAAEIVLVSKLANSLDEATKMVNDVINNGAALDKFRQMISYQEGNPKITEDYHLMPIADESIDLFYTEKKNVKVCQIDALRIGEAAMILGAGRLTKEDKIDYGVGVYLHKKIGDSVKENDVIATIYTNGQNTEKAIEMVLEAYQLTDGEEVIPPIILDIVR